MINEADEDRAIRDYYKSVGRDSELGDKMFKVDASHIGTMVFGDSYVRELENQLADATQALSDIVVTHGGLMLAKDRQIEEMTKDRDKWVKAFQGQMIIAEGYEQQIEKMKRCSNCGWGKNYSCTHNIGCQDIVKRETWKPEE